MNCAKGDKEEDTIFNRKVGTAILSITAMSSWD